jgi:transcriptional regulator with XRE-family HTH domain
MAQSSALVQALKRVLKARAITYAQVAKAIGVSEATVKRMFSQESFTLKRFDEICEVSGVELIDLARSADSKRQHVSQLTLEQEKEIVGNAKLLLVAVCALNHLTFEQILGAYTFTEAELIHLLTRLDKLKFIELAPGNRIRLLVARTFAWLPDGPIQQYFKSQAQHEYFRSRFDGEDELLLLASGQLSKASIAAMIAKLKRAVGEFSELHQEDMALPLERRRGTSMLVAIRPWSLDAFRAMERKPDALPASQRRAIGD